MVAEKRLKRGALKAVVLLGVGRQNLEHARQQDTSPTILDCDLV